MRMVSKLLKAVTTATLALCLLGAQVQVASAGECEDACATAYNNCTTAAGNAYNACVENARNTFQYCMAGCLIIGLVNPIAGLACIAVCELNETAALNACENTYNAAMTSCQQAYDACIAACPKG